MSEQSLRQALDEYKKADEAFSNCPELALSDPDQSEEVKAISCNFFAARDNLVKEAELCNGNSPLELKAKCWLKWYNESEKCVELMFNSTDITAADEAARIMNKFNKAEIDLMSTNPYTNLNESCCQNKSKRKFDISYSTAADFMGIITCILMMIQTFFPMFLGLLTFPLIVAFCAVTAYFFFRKGDGILGSIWVLNTNMWLFLMFVR